MGIDKYANTLGAIRVFYDAEVNRGLILSLKEVEKRKDMMGRLFDLGEQVGLSKKDIVRGIMTGAQGHTV